MNSIASVNTIRFITLVLLQVLVLSHIYFLGYINPYLYILFIILFPVKNNRIVLLLLSFLLGITVDMFLDSGGMHAAACVTIAYIRPMVLKFCFGTIYEHQTIKFNQVEIGQKLTYISILTLIHHFILFLFEVFNFSKIILVLQKTLFSSIFTIILCVLVTIIFSRKTK
ncbi:rod shape-determining protein MreD [Oceanihabitans sediminis]|uniref:Rod shape-determining protein MreD n=1 Tax=Oceanihabitans sediminis TaxID=1812012 RepID=A0A368P674_9FLAO|nr:rod shape-determining protein MreD [Oceanihabitans sediminis]MDX1278356.1 rod shape-determining protein MreD [Oceanihabitans sediminis]MDX1772600.1 rod shape-determining protein MreD [Oceanihabitans sediminis]RBP34267.1 rod shape-determining protein MreD [Oceanihabitans sediminis]RCU57956.1 rod shape-determining protein MreD [Oceanihabitans sediminis]